MQGSNKNIVIGGIEYREIYAGHWMDASGKSIVIQGIEYREIYVRQWMEAGRLTVPSALKK